jgi:hypothetical protein
MMNVIFFGIEILKVWDLSERRGVQIFDLLTFVRIERDTWNQKHKDPKKWRANNKASLADVSCVAAGARTKIKSSNALPHVFFFCRDW